MRACARCEIQGKRNRYVRESGIFQFFPRQSNFFGVRWHGNDEQRGISAKNSHISRKNRISLLLLDFPAAFASSSYELEDSAHISHIREISPYCFPMAAYSFQSRALEREKGIETLVFPQASAKRPSSSGASPV